MLDNPLRVGVPFQVRLAISPAWMRFLCCIVPDIVIVFQIPLNLLDEFNNPSKPTGDITPVLSARCVDIYSC